MVFVQRFHTTSAEGRLCGWDPESWPWAIQRILQPATIAQMRRGDDRPRHGERGFAQGLVGRSDATRDGNGGQRKIG